MVLHHVGRFQIFNGDSLVSINVVTRGFMKGVLTFVGNALIVTHYIVFGFLASVAALLALGKSPLGMSQLLCTFLSMFGIVDDMPIAISHEVTNTHIETNSILFLGKRFRFGLTDALEIPTRGTQDNTGKFESAFHRTVDNAANVTATESRGVKIVSLERTSSISELNSIPGLGVLETRETNL